MATGWAMLLPNPPFTSQPRKAMQGLSDYCSRLGQMLEKYLGKKAMAIAKENSHGECVTILYVAEQAQERKRKVPRGSATLATSADHKIFAPSTFALQCNVKKLCCMRLDIDASAHDSNVVQHFLQQFWTAWNTANPDYSRIACIENPEKSEAAARAFSTLLGRSKWEGMLSVAQGSFVDAFSRHDFKSPEAAAAFARNLIQRSIDLRAKVVP